VVLPRIPHNSPQIHSALIIRTRTK
jgi:hypothetical protein